LAEASDLQSVHRGAGPPARGRLAGTRNWAPPPSPRGPERWVARNRPEMQDRNHRRARPHGCWKCLHHGATRACRPRPRPGFPRERRRSRSLNVDLPAKLPDTFPGPRVPAPMVPEKPDDPCPKPPRAERSCRDRGPPTPARAGFPPKRMLSPFAGQKAAAQSGQAPRFGLQ